jgi:hypothetical protein
MSADLDVRHIALRNRLQLIASVADDLADRVSNQWAHLPIGLAQVARDAIVDVDALLNPEDEETVPAGGGQ